MSDPTSPILSTPPAVQLYTVREQLAADRVGVLAALAGFGYGAVEPFDVLTDAPGLRDDLDAAGLAVCAVHAPVLSEDVDALFDGARTVGADTVIVPVALPERFGDRDAVTALAAELNAVASRAADAGLRLGYHNHEFEFTDVDGSPALVVLADALAPEVVLEVDTYWAAVAGQDVPALLRRLGDRVRYLHVKDGPVTRTDPMTAVGAGRMPVAEVLTANPAVEWRVVELDDCATDVLAAVGDSLDWLRDNGFAHPAGGGSDR
ncbi:sugar phosphate isomerase/epimerase family protein [Actinoalloteichus caeruleus]|uniref:sugar phosphate isomerase/epimerase family protein n=1 Tax=Actinoalloteichus cyanogriseus TaxID=2893586 RepID=UPI003BB858B3